METALNNLLRTDEAQKLIQLLGENGFDEYVMSILERSGGNFDEALKMMQVHAMATERLREQGIPIDYRLLSLAPSPNQAGISTPSPYPTPAPRYTPPPVMAPAPAPVIQEIPRYQENVLPPQITITPPAQAGQRMDEVNINPPQPVPIQNPVQPTFIQQSGNRPQPAYDGGYRPSLTPTPMPQRITRDYGGAISPTPTGTPNVVPPFQKGAYMTEGIGGYVGHMGEDYGYDPGGTQRAVTNPIGGIPFAGTQYGGYGNYYGVIGMNEQEYQQLSPQEKQALIEETQRKMPYAYSLKDLNIPNRNIVLQAHLAQPQNKLSPYVATGSARLTMGSTGNSTGLHTHEEILDRGGNLRGLESFSKQYGNPISYPQGQGGTGGGRPSQAQNPLMNVLGAAQKAFAQITRPIANTYSSPQIKSPARLPTPTPTPAPRSVYTPPKTQIASNPVNYSPPRSSPTPAPKSAPISNTFARIVAPPKPYTPPRPSPTPAPRSYVAPQKQIFTPMKSSFKPVTYSRPAPQQTFVQKAQKVISNLFRK